MALLRRSDLMPVDVVVDPDTKVPVCIKLLDARLPDEARELAFVAHQELNPTINHAGCMTLALFLAEVMPKLPKLERGQSRTSMATAIKEVAQVWKAVDNQPGWKDDEDAIAAVLMSVEEFETSNNSWFLAAQTTARQVRRWLSRQPPSSSTYQQASLAGGPTLFIRDLIKQALAERKMSIVTEFKLRCVVRTAVQSAMNKFANCTDPAYAQQVGFIMSRIVEIYDEYVRSHRGDEDVHSKAAGHCLKMLHNGLKEGFTKVSSTRHRTSRSR